MKRTNIPKRLRFEILQRDGFRCQYCGAPASKSELHVDHIHPVSAGGTNHPLNLITACSDCNAGKGACIVRRVAGRRLRPEEAIPGTPVIHTSFRAGAVLATAPFVSDHGCEVVALRLLSPGLTTWGEKRPRNPFHSVGLSQLRLAPTHYFAGRWFLGGERGTTGYRIAPFRDQGWEVFGPDEYCDLLDSYEKARSHIELHAEDNAGGALQFLNGQKGALH